MARFQFSRRLLVVCGGNGIKGLCHVESPWGKNIIAFAITGPTVDLHFDTANWTRFVRWGRLAIDWYWSIPIIRLRVRVGHGTGH